jgi:hypothetical protein
MRWLVILKDYHGPCTPSLLHKAAAKRAHALKFDSQLVVPVSATVEASERKVSQKGLGRRRRLLNLGAADSAPACRGVIMTGSQSPNL